MLDADLSPLFLFVIRLLFSSASNAEDLEIVPYHDMADNELLQKSRHNMML
ncbi:MAG: hypothetical protein ACYCXK_10200 [Candidatus Humimicrobiaceae bacterium]